MAEERYGEALEEARLEVKQVKAPATQQGVGGLEEAGEACDDASQGAARGGKAKGVKLPRKSESGDDCALEELCEVERGEGVRTRRVRMCASLVCSEREGVEIAIVHKVVSKRNSLCFYVCLCSRVHWRMTEARRGLTPRKLKTMLHSAPCAWRPHRWRSTRPFAAATASMPSASTPGSARAAAGASSLPAPAVGSTSRIAHKWGLHIHAGCNSWQGTTAGLPLLSAALHGRRGCVASDQCASIEAMQP